MINPKKAEKKETLTFIDLFAGIGGFRLALQKEGLRCVFSSEINKHACEMYELNYGDNPYCDITSVNIDNIPNFDILCAGFPCQPFSVSGKQKGFQDTRGSLFFNLVNIIKDKKPKSFILENVKNLVTHNKGHTLGIMIKTLTDLGYNISYRVLNAKDFNVPQNRERIILIGNSLNMYFDFNKIKTYPVQSMQKYLSSSDDFETLDESEYTLIPKNLVKVQPQSGLIFVGYRNKKLRGVGVKPNTEYLSRVHKQPNRIYSSSGLHPTLPSQETSGRYWIYHKNVVRKLTLNECYRFMGYPDSFKKIGSKSNLYERIGNSVCVPMIQEIIKEVKKQIFTINS